MPFSLLLCKKNLHDQEQVSIAGSARQLLPCPHPLEGWVHFCSKGCSSYMPQYLQICSTVDLENPCQRFIGLIYALGVALG